jgi:predicted RNase H-like HicB family nuclease
MCGFMVCVGNPRLHAAFENLRHLRRLFLLERKNPVLAKRKNLCHSAHMKREYNVVIERDSEGFYVASVPELHGCHTQARSLDKLLTRIKEAIELCLEVEDSGITPPEFIGVQRVAVEV